MPCTSLVGSHDVKKTPRFRLIPRRAFSFSKELLSQTKFSLNRAQNHSPIMIVVDAMLKHDFKSIGLIDDPIKFRSLMDTRKANDRSFN